MTRTTKVNSIITGLVIVFSLVAELSCGYNIHAPNKDVTFEKSYDVTKKFIGRQNVPETVCSNESSLEHFPEDLFTEEQRSKGAFLLHLLGAVYCFTFLAVVCNYYFLPAVECICEDLSIPKDVAAATFMSTATAMPEFFTNSISTLITNSEMGVGNIIGSLMFNTLGVAAVSGLALQKPLQLDWWPVCRDCVIYGFHTVVLMIVAWGGVITLAESIVMVLLCVLYYFTIIITNYKLKNRLRIFVEDHLNCCVSTRYDLTLPVEYSAKGKLPLHKKHNDHRQHGIFVVTPTEFSLPSPVYPVKDIHLDEEEEEEQSSPFKLPRGSWLQKIWWVYSWPIRFILTCICPNPKTIRRLYPVTFLMCIAFIGGNSFIIVWMLTVFGSTFRIPEVVMGLTILSAGSAMPEALSSIVSVRKGESGIGVSNALGANSLSILLSLGVPWFLKNAMNTSGAENVIHISSDGIEYIIGVLMLSTLTLFVILAVSGFRLRRVVGFVLLIMYLFYISIQVMIEMHIFFPSEDGC